MAEELLDYFAPGEAVPLLIMGVLVIVLVRLHAAPTERTGILPLEYLADRNRKLEDMCRVKGVAEVPDGLAGALEMAAEKIRDPLLALRRTTSAYLLFLALSTGALGWYLGEPWGFYGCVVLAWMAIYVTLIGIGVAQAEACLETAIDLREQKQGNPMTIVPWAALACHLLARGKDARAEDLARRARDRIESLRSEEQK